MNKFLIIFFSLALASTSISAPVAYAAEEYGSEIAEIADSTEDVSDISEEELMEAEPSELPEVEEDDALTERLFGRMLLDVEGNGEVYYVDPVTGGKEYLADGVSAHRLLERRALGISEENFAKLILGENRDDSSVCAESPLGRRLRGRIVIRVEANGEAYWILPTNCRAYYVGTHKAAYELMKKFSLGITKKNLAKVADNNRQRLKRAYRYHVYAYAGENDVSLDDAHQAMKDKAKQIRDCYRDAGFEPGDGRWEEKITKAKVCAEEAGITPLNRETRKQVRKTIRGARQERIQNRIEQIKDMNIGDLFKQIKNRLSQDGANDN